MVSIQRLTRQQLLRAMGDLLDDLVDVAVAAGLEDREDLMVRIYELRVQLVEIMEEGDSEEDTN